MKNFWKGILAVLALYTGGWLQGAAVNFTFSNGIFYGIPLCFLGGLLVGTLSSKADFWDDRT